MKHRRAFALVVVILIALSLLPVQPVSAQATVIPCEGNLFPAGITEMGTWTYPGGNTHVRGMVAQYVQVMGDPRCSGSNTVVTNANWDAYGVGPSWGTFQMALADGSPAGWNGTWTGMTYPDRTRSIRVEGHGYGDLEGMKVFVNIAFPGPYASGVASGYILDPHGE